MLLAHKAKRNFKKSNFSFGTYTALKLYGLATGLVFIKKKQKMLLLLQLATHHQTIGNCCLLAACHCWQAASNASKQQFYNFPLLRIALNIYGKCLAAFTFVGNKSMLLFFFSFCCGRTSLRCTKTCSTSTLFASSLLHSFHLL